jgi:cardiolipin synthase
VEAFNEIIGWPWWGTTFFAVGVLATLSIIVSMFFALGRRPNRFSVSARPPVDSQDFLMGLSGTLNAPFESGGSARLLNNGVEIFPAILEAIRGAERSVHFMAYIWEPGKASAAILGALTERARAGVEVRLMLDGMGGMKAPRQEIRDLIDAGGKVQWFHAFKLGKLTSFYKRNHRRAIVIDGRVAFTGGAAVADVWLGDAQDEKHWRDMMVEVRGCLAVNLQSAFTQLWANTCGEILIGDAYYPDDPPEEKRGRETLKHINVLSSPAEASHPLRIFYWTSFACARERIWLTSPYFVPDENTREVIADRARAGVDVRLLVPNTHTDARMVRWASHAYYGEMLEAGVRIYEYQTTMIHAKTLVVDGRWSIMGSANMDIRSKELNQESVIGLLDRDLGRQLEETFLDDLKESKEIRLEEWKRRSIVNRPLERFCLLFAEQY